MKFVQLQKLENVGIFLESHFTPSTESLWNEMAQVLQKPNHENIPWHMARMDDIYRFYLAYNERIFSQPVMKAFLMQLRNWGKAKLGTRFASTPQVHIYTRGCHRELARDAGPAHWHYLYSLSRKSAFQIQIIQNIIRQESTGLTSSRAIRMQLYYGQMIVHKMNHIYGVRSETRDSDPSQGAVLLHGYLW